MQFPLVAPLGNRIPFRSQIPGHIFRQGFNRKPCPISQPNTGMHFPLSPSTGNCIPFQRQIPGRAFRSPAHPESPSHFGRIRARNHRPIRPPINKEASSRTAGHEVHREFRTQRRPLNVAFVLRRTVEQGTSCPPPGRALRLEDGSDVLSVRAGL